MFKLDSSLLERIKEALVGKDLALAGNMQLSSYCPTCTGGCKNSCTSDCKGSCKGGCSSSCKGNSR